VVGMPEAVAVASAPVPDLQGRNSLGEQIDQRIRA